MSNKTNLPNFEPDDSWRRRLRRRIATIKTLQVKLYGKRDPQWCDLARFLTDRLRIERPQFFLSVRFGDDRTARLFERHFSRLIDAMLCGPNLVKRLKPQERSWFLLVPEEHSGEVNYHGYLRLPRIARRRNLSRNFLRFEDASISKHLTRVLRWRFGTAAGTKQNGEERRLPAFVDVQLQRMYDRSYRRIAIYPLKRANSVEHWAERLESSNVVS